VAESIVDFDDGRAKAAMLNQIRGLRGKHRVEITKHRPRRSDRQNRYYWPCFVSPFGQYMREQGEHVTDLQCHEILKNMFLRETATNWQTGDAFDFTRSTADLNTHDFNAYLDACAAWLSETLGIIVPEPSDYHETE
jgi:hypothetical protein